MIHSWKVFFMRQLISLRKLILTGLN